MIKPDKHMNSGKALLIGEHHSPRTVANYMSVPTTRTKSYMIVL